MISAGGRFSFAAGEMQTVHPTDLGLSSPRLNHRQRFQRSVSEDSTGVLSCKSEISTCKDELGL